MLSPEIAMLVMFIASVIIGYITMPIILGLNSPYIRYHSNKVMSSLLMGILMAMIELFMHGGMLSSSRFIIYFIILSSFVLLLYYCIKNQYFVSENDFLNGMIEHHAMGIAMANKYIEPYVGEYGQSIAQSINKLARNIYNVQIKEINEMDMLLESENN
jgi:hypothetical protein